MVKTLKERPANFIPFVRKTGRKLRDAIIMFIDTKESTLVIEKDEISLFKGKTYENKVSVCIGSIRRILRKRQGEFVIGTNHDKTEIYIVRK
jgi:hypothetical protein